MSDHFSLPINKDLLKLLTKMRDNLSLQIRGDASYDLVFRILFKEHYYIPHLKDQITILTKELKEVNLNFKKIIKKKDLELKEKDKEMINLMKELLLAQNSNSNTFPMAYLPQPPHIPSKPPLPPPPPLTQKQIDEQIKQENEEKDLKKKGKLQKKNLQDELKSVIHGNDFSTLLKSPPKEEMDAIKQSRKERAKTPITFDGVDFLTEKNPERFKTIEL